MGIDPDDSNRGARAVGLLQTGNEANRGRIIAGQDKRTRMVRLTVQGREAIARAYPLWRQAQARIVQGSEADRWQLVAGGLEEVAALALRS